MSESKSETLSSVRREIARRLQAGLPLPGMSTAALLYGCEERSSNGNSAGRYASALKRCGQTSEAPAPQKNGQSEMFLTRTMGVPAPPETEPDR